MYGKTVTRALIPIDAAGEGKDGKKKEEGRIRVEL